MIQNFYIVDLAFFGFLAVFVITAYFRGFIKEIFSLFNWAIAFLVSYTLSPYLSFLLEDKIPSTVVAALVMRGAIFIIALIILYFATSGLSRELKKKVPSILDKSLAIFYALIKTLVIFGIIYSATLNSYRYVYKVRISEKSRAFPSWLKEARSHDIIKASAKVVNPVVVLFFKEMTDSINPKKKKYKKKKSDELDEKIDDLIEEGDDNSSLLKLLEDNPDVAEEIEKNSGYKIKDIEKMNRLIQIINQ